jgi:ATP:ADP antiporter, AAA family
MSTSTPSAPEFGKIRAALWPIHGYEMKKFLPMGMIMFFALFNYTILRDVKDVLIMTAPGAGAPVLSFLKGWGVMPSAIVFVLVYTKLSNILSQEKIFYWVVSCFIAFFGLFAFYLYPYQSTLHPSYEDLTRLQEAYPNFRFLFPVWGLWTYSIFYILAELWGSVMISLLFWQFANQTVRTVEAKRYYALFGLLANFALIFSGGTVKYCSGLGAGLSAFDKWGVSLQIMMSALVVCGLLMMVLYKWIHVYVLSDKRYYNPEEAGGAKDKKAKVKLSMVESAKYIFTNPYIGFIAILVLSYGVAINLIEVVWKDQIRQAFPNPNDYGSFMGQFSQNTGIATIILVMFTKGIVRKFGWYVGAIATPLITIITGALFYGLVFFENVMNPLIAVFGVSAALLAAWVGSVQNFLAKGMKYSQFDPTKEMAYIPLDQELRTKGKAAVDVIGGRLGKAFGGYFQQAIYIVTATKDVITVAPYFAGMVAFIVAIWIWAVGCLSNRYNKLIQETESKKAA